MPDKLAIKNISKAIKLLPDPKSYGAEKVTVSVEKHKYKFEKKNEEWHFTA